MVLTPQGSENNDSEVNLQESFDILESFVNSNAFTAVQKIASCENLEAIQYDENIGNSMIQLIDALVVAKESDNFINITEAEKLTRHTKNAVGGLINPVELVYPDSSPEENLIDSFERQIMENIMQIEDVAGTIFERIKGDNGYVYNFNKACKDRNIQKYLLEKAFQGNSNELFEYNDFMSFELEHFDKEDLPENATLNDSQLIITDKFGKTSIINNVGHYGPKEIYLSNLEHIKGNQYKGEGSVTVTI